MNISCLGLLRRALIAVASCQMGHCGADVSLHWHCRSQLLTLVFFGMMMGGFLTAQHLYLWAQRLEAADGSTGPATAVQVGAPCILLL